MIFKEFFILLIFTVNIYQGFTQKINVSVFHKYDIKAIVFSGLSAKYNINGDGIPVNMSEPYDVYSITAENNSISIRDKEKLIGDFGKLEFTATDKSGIFQIKPTTPHMPAREYDDDLVIISGNGYLQIINKIDIEKYISGVVETEGGDAAPTEFYKSQAILIRTYAFKNIHKHSGNGFSLCDDIHCQAYNGRSRNYIINQAVKETQGMVMTDRQNNLLTAPYHSNCGGITTNASDVWLKDHPYLVSIKDPFCSQGKNARWIRKIPVKDWEDYLRKCGIYTEKSRSADYDFVQSERKRYYSFRNQKILLTRIREDWNLKSTFFSVNFDDNILILSGRGFGHGVGLCQEGAIEMARVGYTYTDILHFYFRYFHITDYKEVGKP